MMQANSSGRALGTFGYWLALLCLLLGCSHVFSKENHVWIMHSADLQTNIDALAKFRETVAIAPVNLHPVDIKNFQQPKEQPAFVITIGTEAAEKALDMNFSCPVLSFLVTESGFKELATRNKLSTNNALEKNYSALVMEQALLRYISLGKNLIPNAKKIGMLIGPNTEYRKQEAKAVANAMDLELAFATIDEKSNPVRILEPVIANVDFFIVVPDTNIINQTTSRWILELSYRHSTPVIGYSARYADAGALAGIFTTPQALGLQAGQWLLQALVIPPSRGQIFGPQDLQIVLNPSVARANNITLKNAESYRQLLVPGGTLP